MIFDELWRLERAEREEIKRISDFYHPKLEAAHRAKDEQEYQSLLCSMQLEYSLNEDAEALRTKRLEQCARRLGIEIPSKTSQANAGLAYGNENWDYNHVTGKFTFNSKTEAAITREVRKAKTEQLQYRMRFVSQVAIPLTGLLGTLIGVVSLFFRHR